ncbi:MAG: transketolase [Thermoplasmata archaeon]
MGEVTVSDPESARVNAIRFLAVDMVERAKSGHPGLPLGAAPMAYVLWDRFLKHNPANPSWWDRDRFILSAGHGSALLYALLHLTGYDLPLSELENFRQWGSRTPGHPEHGLTPGVEATTGPLGQGFAMGIGFALAERALADRYNRPGQEIVDHWTYALCSDGDLMEGISSEAASLAGHLGVGKLVYLYDDNRVSLEGPTDWSFTEDVEKRFAAYGWSVAHVEDGTDLSAIDAAVRAARKEPDRPHLIRVRSHIGFGSPKQDTKDAHGEALGPEATRKTKEKLGWPTEPPFYVPTEVREHFRAARDRGARWEAEWNERFRAYRQAEPERAREYVRRMEGRLPEGWDLGLPSFAAGSPALATRDASGRAMQALAQALPELMGGSADLNPSTKTYLEGAGDFSFHGPSGRNLHFGVREHAMAAIGNGLALHGGVRPFGATFLIFSDYARPAIRLGALMGCPTVMVLTHDSVALGEDGPSHQPVEQIAALRAIPGLTVIRPADANETVVAWRAAVQATGPVALILSRQKLPVLEPGQFSQSSGPARGGYVVREAARAPARIVLLGTGAEVHLCLAAQERLEQGGVPTRVVSLPSLEIFARQSAEYRQGVLPPGVPRVAVEAASPFGWERWTGPDGAILGIDRFGASAPGEVVLREFGFTAENVERIARALLKERI